MIPTVTPSTARKKIRKSRRMLLRIRSGESSSCNRGFENVLDHTNRVAVDLDRVVDVFAVAAGHHSHDWNFVLVTLTHHIAVTLAQPIDREREPAELVFGEGIGAGEIEDDLRIVCERGRQVTRECL